MSIQGSINQLLTLAGAAASLSPDLKEAREVAKLEKGLKNRTKVEKKVPGIDEEKLEELAQYEADTLEQIASINPSKKNLKRLGVARYELEEITEGREETEKMEREKEVSRSAYLKQKAESDAAEKLAEEQEKKRISESFINWRNL